MNDRVYEGVCIGGPLAGQRLAERWRNHRVAVMESTFTRVPGPTPEVWLGRDFTYVWMPLPTPDERGIWVEEGKLPHKATFDELFAMLFDSYMRHAEQLRTLAEDGAIDPKWWRE